MTINGQKVIGTKFAYDGCHKMYILNDEQQEHEALELGYEVRELSDLQSTWENSCPMRFIGSWDLSELYVPQCKQAVFTI